MPKFKVTMTATVWQEVEVEAENEEQAQNKAWFDFESPTVTGGDGECAMLDDWFVAEVEPSDDAKGDEE